MNERHQETGPFFDLTTHEGVSNFLVYHSNQRMKIPGKHTNQKAHFHPETQTTPEVVDILNHIVSQISSAAGYINIVNRPDTSEDLRNISLRHIREFGIVQNQLGLVDLPIDIISHNSLNTFRSALPPNVERPLFHWANWWKKSDANQAVLSNNQLITTNLTDNPNSLPQQELARFFPEIYNSFSVFRFQLDAFGQITHVQMIDHDGKEIDLAEFLKKLPESIKNQKNEINRKRNALKTGLKTAFLFGQLDDYKKSETEQAEEQQILQEICDLYPGDPGLSMEQAQSFSQLISSFPANDNWIVDDRTSTSILYLDEDFRPLRDVLLTAWGVLEKKQFIKSDILSLLEDIQKQYPDAINQEEAIDKYLKYCTYNLKTLPSITMIKMPGWLKTQAKKVGVKNEDFIAEPISLYELLYINS